MEMSRRVNLLVVVAITSISVPLGIVGIYKLRAEGHKLECQSRMRAIGIALRNYEDSERQFPLGVIENPSLPLQARLSWIVSILPFVEAENPVHGINKTEA